MDRDWYSPQECNKFWREHCIFLIKNITTLREGHWVPNPEGTGYVDTGIGHRQVRPYANYETSIWFASAITKRLQKCGVDGLITEAYYACSETEESLAKHLETDEFDVQRRIRGVIKYISGKMKGKYHRWYNPK